MLHTLSSSPWHTDLRAMLRLVKDGDDLLLLSDGVIAAIAGGPFLEILRSAPITIHALQDDIDARGWLVKLRTVSSGLAILISSECRSNILDSCPGNGGIVVYFLTPFRHRPKILRPHII